MPDHAKSILSTLTFGLISPRNSLLNGEGIVTESISSAEDSRSQAPAHGERGGQPGVGGGGYGGGGGVAKYARGGLTINGGANEPAATPQLSSPAGSAALTPADQPVVNADIQTLAAITQQESQRANRVAQLRDMQQQVAVQQGQAQQNDEGSLQQTQVNQRIAAPILSDAELARIEGAFDAAYKILKGIRDKNPTSITAEQVARRAPGDGGSFGARWPSGSGRPRWRSGS